MRLPRVSNVSKRANLIAHSSCKESICCTSKVSQVVVGSLDVTRAEADLTEEDVMFESAKLTAFSTVIVHGPTNPY